MVADRPLFSYAELRRNVLLEEHIASLGEGLMGADFEDERVTRRDSFVWLAGGAATLSFSTSGCILLPLLRLFIGRGAIRAVSRAAISGRSAAALTFGRGVSVGARAATLSRRASAPRLGSLPKSEIIGPDKKVAARSVNEGEGTAVYVDGSKVFRSIRTADGVRHFDTKGDAGRSIYRRNDVVVHKNTADTIIAIDRLRRAANIIEHLDNNGKVIGTTKCHERDDGYQIEADATAVYQIEKVRKELSLNCPDTKMAYDKMVSTREACLRDGGDVCQSVGTLERRYNYLDDMCEMSSR